MFVHPPHKRMFVTTKSPFWVKLNFVEGKVGEMAVYIMEVFVEIKSSLSFKSIMFLLNFIVLILMEKITEPVFKSHYLLPLLTKPSL